MADNWHDKPFEELTKEEIEQLKREEAEEAPSTAQTDGALSYNQTFTGVRIRYNGAEEFLQAMADRANLYADDYLDARQEALHYIATQTLFDFDAPVEDYVLGLVKSIGLSHAKRAKQQTASILAHMVYPIAKRMIPNQLMNAYKLYPEAFVRMEGLHLYDEYTGLDGHLRGFNAWIELDLPAYLTSQDVHDEIERMANANEHFYLRLRMAIRRAHRTAMTYRRKSFKMTLKLSEIKKMTYGGFANAYPVTFHGVCKYITGAGLNTLVEANASSHGAIAKGLVEPNQILN